MKKTGCFCLLIYLLTFALAAFAQDDDKEQVSVLNLTIADKALKGKIKKSDLKYLTSVIRKVAVGE